MAQKNHARRNPGVHRMRNERSDIRILKQNADHLRLKFESVIRENFPGCDEYHWYRALAAAAGGIGRRNDNTSRDAAMAADKGIEEAHVAYISAIHKYYRARDGESGFLGGRA